ncbi:hypothetical protein L2D08_01325 [Domibacillus sp. PGB-M46]|uniref:hypothetical protein n=1 Tax=Domibacillus sp. PGB-M46 TaxID=2910255 RepID=UPI001F58792F|nr:hypothetical protein [Domibacillus sp. PGB-M46]MCI2252999.1 hypothetical protein [Domibacillus sp. PGB-M46]
MAKNHQDYKKFLEEQIEWCQEQDLILEEIESKLLEMKEIAEYALKRELTPSEAGKLNGQLNDLKSKIHSLEKKLHSDVH